jgi:hypothetical protein
MARNCAREGHVLVEDDPLVECLSCGTALQVGDVIGVKVTNHRRHLGELSDPADTAPVREWGTGGTVA